VFGIEPRSVVVLAAVSSGMLLIAAAATLPSMIRAMRGYSAEPRFRLTRRARLAIDRRGIGGGIFRRGEA
jgi:hypothetical protein